MLKQTVTVIALMITPSLSAAEICIHELPAKREGHWRYRYVDHEKCWYGPGAEQVRREQRKRPPRIESIAKDIEEEIPDQTLYEARRVRIFPVKREPSANNRIDATFNEFVIRCETDIRACDGLRH